MAESVLLSFPCGCTDQGCTGVGKDTASLYHMYTMPCHIATWQKGNCIALKLSFISKQTPSLLALQAGGPSFQCCAHLQIFKQRVPCFQHRKSRQRCCYLWSIRAPYKLKGCAAYIVIPLLLGTPYNMRCHLYSSVYIMWNGRHNKPTVSPCTQQA